MCEFEDYVVDLSDYPLNVSIPGYLGGILGRIADAGPAGISSIRLLAEGYDSIQQSIDELGGLGAMIAEEHRIDPDWTRDQPNGVAHFYYQGWFVSTAQILATNTTLEVPK